MILLIFLILIFSKTVFSRSLIFAQYIKNYKQSKVDYFIVAEIKKIDTNYVFVKYDIQLNPIPRDNPVIFLEYTVSFPKYVVIKHISVNNKAFAKKIRFQIKQHNELKTFLIKPNNQRVVLDKTIDITFMALIPFKKIDNNIFIAYIPTFDNINNLLKPTSYILFYPYIHDNYSALVKFNNIQSLLQDMAHIINLDLQRNIYNILKITYSFIKFKLIIVSIIIIIVYNILWIMYKILKLINKI